MRELSPLQNILYQIGGVLLIIGAALPIFTDCFAAAFFTFAPGAVLFVWMQVLQGYDGKNFVIRRLRHLQLVGAFFLVATAVLMFMHWKQIAPCRGGEWQIALCIAAIQEVYTAFRIPTELKKEK